MIANATVRKSIVEELESLAAASAASPLDPSGLPSVRRMTVVGWSD